MKKLGDYFKQVDIKRLGNKAPFAVYTRWKAKVEAGLRIVGINKPEDLAPESVENISFYIFEDKF